MSSLRPFFFQGLVGLFPAVGFPFFLPISYTGSLLFLLDFLHLLLSLEPRHPQPPPPSASSSHFVYSVIEKSFPLISIAISISPSIFATLPSFAKSDNGGKRTESEDRGRSAAGVALADIDGSVLGSTNSPIRA